MKDNKKKNYKIKSSLKIPILISLIFLSGFIGMISCSFNENKYAKVLVLLIGALIALIGIFYSNKFKIDRSIIIIFFFFIPFMTELNVFYKEDFHIVAKEYYRFNYLHVFSIYFLIQIFKYRRNIRRGLDITMLILFNIVCLISLIGARNVVAGLQDYYRYFNLTIVYIFFSRVFNFQYYKNIIINCLLSGEIIQLAIGILQKIKGNRVGLTILGEGGYVFRTADSFYEKGFSGTFGHPGPMALYANILLIVFLFNKDIIKSKKTLGIIVSSLIIIMAAGRTSIVIMICIYLAYLFNEIIQINLKSILLTTLVSFVMIIGVIVMQEKLEPIVDRFINSDIDYQYDNRMIHINIGFKYIEKKPLLGLGLNNYLDNTKVDYPLQFGTNFYLSNPIHNMYIQYITEIGYIGFSVLAIFILQLMYLYFKVNKGISVNERNLYRGIELIVIVWLIYGLQGWAGIQTRNWILVLIACSVMSNKYYKVNT